MAPGDESASTAARVVCVQCGLGAQPRRASPHRASALAALPLSLRGDPDPEFRPLPLGSQRAAEGTQGDHVPTLRTCWLLPGLRSPGPASGRHLPRSAR